MIVYVVYRGVSNLDGNFRFDAFHCCLLCIRVFFRPPATARNGMAVRRLRFDGAVFCAPPPLTSTLSEISDSAVTLIRRTTPAQTLSSPDALSLYGAPPWPHLIL